MLARVQVHVPSSGEFSFRSWPEMTTSLSSGSATDIFLDTLVSAVLWSFFNHHVHACSSSNSSAHSITHAHSARFPGEFPSGHVRILQVTDPVPTLLEPPSLRLRREMR